MYKKDDDFWYKCRYDQSYYGRQINWETVAAQNKWAIASQAVWKNDDWSGFLAARILNRDLSALSAASVFYNFI
jgi:hypothetical protein